MPLLASTLPAKTLESRSVSEAFRRRLIFGLSMGWGGTVVSSFVSVTRISLLFRYLETEVLGIWFLMIGAQATLGLLDFGFAKTLERRLAFAKGKCGPNPNVVLDADAQQSIRDLFAIARRVYNVLSVFVFAALTGGGFLYFLSIEMPEGLFGSFCIAWVIMCVGYAANMWGWYIQSAMSGLGDIGLSRGVGTVLSLLSLCLTWLVLVAGWGLPALSAVWVMRGLIERAIGWLIIRKRNKWIGKVRGHLNTSTFKSMLAPSIKWWVTIVGAFLATDIVQFIIGAYLGTGKVPDFVATWGLLMMVSGFSAAVVGISMPLLSQMWSAGDSVRIQRYVFKLTRIGLVLVVGMVTGIGVYAPELFELWLGPGHFIGYTAFILMACNIVLCCHHGMLNIPCLAAEEMGFYKYMILGGILNIALSPYLTNRYGIEGACLAMFLSCLLTVNWIIPVLFFRLFHVRASEYTLKVLLPAMAAGVFVLVCATLSKQFLLPVVERLYQAITE